MNKTPGLLLINRVKVSIRVLKMQVLCMLVYEFANLKKMYLMSWPCAFECVLCVSVCVCVCMYVTCVSKRVTYMF